MKWLPQQALSQVGLNFALSNFLNSADAIASMFKRTKVRTSIVGRKPITLAKPLSNRCVDITHIPQDLTFCLLGGPSESLIKNQWLSDLILAN